MIAYVLQEQLRGFHLPALECLNRRVVPQRFLRQVLVVQPHKAVQRLLQILGTVEVMRAKHLAQTAVESFDHPVGLRRPGLGQSMLNAQRLAQLIEFMFPCGLAAVTAK
ncbi:hypothetical protein SDC9_166130 [bioreactor metagenome]|uniref:Uncharacterized protein n=1 Tax=bioreactor metagenome TaxID=1076179 RepID=A0A645FWD0_9ZZZZ